MIVRLRTYLCLSGRVILPLLLILILPLKLSASIVTMGWEGTISYDLGPFHSGDTISGTFAIDDSVIGKGNSVNPACTDYDGAVLSLTVSCGAYAWMWHGANGGLGGNGGLQVFDNSNPADFPWDALTVVPGWGEPVIGSQIGGQDVTSLILVFKQYGVSLGEPPNVLTSQSIPSTALSFDLCAIYFLEDGTIFGSGAFSCTLTPVPEPSTFFAGAFLVIPFCLQGIRHLRNRNRVS